MTNTLNKLILLSAILIMRCCTRILNKESVVQNEYCWPVNSISDLEKTIKEKL